MRFSVDIYNHERILRSALRKVENSSICIENKTKILEFYRECLTQGLSKARIIKYVNTLERIARILGKSFLHATRDDIAEFIRKIEEKKLL